MRWVWCWMLVVAGCGPTVALPDVGGDGTGTDAGDDDDDDDDGPGAEDEDGPDDTVDESDSGDVDDCDMGAPAVRAVRYYAGNAARTVGRDLIRGEDGTLYMAGSMADASNVGQWIAATAEHGGVLWEVFERLEPGGNLRAAPTIDDLARRDDLLVYAGWGQATGVVGVADPYGDYEEIGPMPDLTGVFVQGVASDDPSTFFLVGRTEQAATILRLDGPVSTWQLNGLSADPITQANDVALAGNDLYVVGERGELPWLGSFDASSAAETLSRVADSGTTFEPEGGEFSALALGNDRIVAVGSIRHNKPKPDGSTGSFIFNEAFARAYTLEGDTLWTWQPGATSIRPGSLRTVTIGPDGTTYFAGNDAEIEGNDAPLAGALGTDGVPVWTLPSESFGVDLEYFHATGIALGEPGQLFVLVSSQALSAETTAVIEICY